MYDLIMSNKLNLFRKKNVTNILSNHNLKEKKIHFPLTLLAVNSVA